MALIKCPKCGKEFSDRIVACPQCGYSMKSLSHVSLGFVIAGLMLLVLKIITMCIPFPTDINSPVLALYKIVNICFWLYMGGFWIHQIIISQRRWSPKIYSFFGIVICLYYIVLNILPNDIIMRIPWWIRDYSVTIWILLLFGLCMLLNSVYYRETVKYAFIGCGILWIFSHIFSYFMPGCWIGDGLLSALLVLIIVSLLVLLVYWALETKHSMQEKSKKYTFSLVETILIIVTIVSVILSILMYNSVIYMVSLSIAIPASTMSFILSLQFPSKEYNYIFSALLFTGSIFMLFAVCSMDGDNRSFDTFRKIDQVLEILTSFGIILSIMACYAPSLMSKFNLKIK